MEENNEEMIGRLATFIRKLCALPHDKAFILDKAFTYAVRLQGEKSRQEMALRGVSYEIDDMDTGTMEQAAAWMEEAIKSDSHLYQYLY